jgi:hypothetical protein
MPKMIDPALRERAVRLGVARESVHRWVTKADIDDASAGDNLGGVGGDQATEGGESSVAGDDDILKAATVFSPGSLIPATLIMAFVADQVAQGRRIESICRELREHVCQVAARTCRSGSGPPVRSPGARSSTPQCRKGARWRLDGRHPQGAPAGRRGSLRGAEDDRAPASTPDTSDGAR